MLIEFTLNILLLSGIFSDILKVFSVGKIINFIYWQMRYGYMLTELIKLFVQHGKEFNRMHHNIK